jgi:hypothetical protein
MLNFAAQMSPHRPAHPALSSTESLPYRALLCVGQRRKFSTLSRQVMNPPGDRPEAGNLANTAPLPRDRDRQRRGKTGMSSRPEARPVTATARHPHRQTEASFQGVG